MRSTEIELEKLNKLWATLQTSVMEIDALTKRAIHDADRKQRRLDDTQQISNLGAKLVASENRHDMLQIQYSNLVRVRNDLHTSYTNLLDLYNNLQAEVKTLREVPAPEPVSSLQLINDIIKLVTQYSTAKTVTKENVYVIIAALLSKGSTSDQLVAKLKSIL